MICNSGSAYLKRNIYKQKIMPEACVESSLDFYMPICNFPPKLENCTWACGKMFQIILQKVYFTLADLSYICN
jgi:hypothetical protein